MHYKLFKICKIFISVCYTYDLFYVNEMLTIIKNSPIPIGLKL